MSIHLITEKATSEQLREMMVELGSYVKVAVDIQFGKLAGGGELHADCETVLLESGSKQDDVWGADWYPDSQETGFESMINIRPRLSNFSLEIQDESTRTRVREIAETLLGGVSVD